MQKSILIAFFLNFFTFLTFSQNVKLEWFNIKNGLPQNSVKDITKDNFGFIWLSTENGLVRYDGALMEKFNGINLKNQRFDFFYSSSNNDTIYTNNIFEENIVGIANRTIFVSNKTKFDDGYKSIFKNNFHLHHDESLKYKFIYKNRLYYVNDSLCFYHDKITKSINKINIKINLNEIDNLFIYNELLFYTDTKSKIVYQFEKGKLLKIDADPLFFSKESKLYWSQTNNQFFLINNKNLYLGTFENNKLIVNKLTNLDDFMDYGIQSLYYDKNYSKLFIGTPADGLCIVSFSNFKIPKKNDSSNSSISYSLLPFGKNAIIDPTGAVFAKTGIIKDFNFPKPVEKFTMSYDSKENIWVKRFNTLYKYNKNQNYTFTDSISSKNYINAIFTFKNFDALCYTIKNSFGEVIFYEKDDFRKIIKTYKLKRPINIVTQISVHEFLFGGRNGLYRVTMNTNKIQKIDEKKDIEVKNIIKSSTGNIWVLTYGDGIWLLKNNKLLQLPLDRENALKIVHTFLEDKKGAFWITTNNGLFKVKESDLLAYVSRKKRVNYYKYTMEDGFNTDEFNGGCSPSSAILENGDFVLPSLDGFVFFNPDAIKSYYPKNMFVERARIDNKDITFFNKTLFLENNFFRADIFIDVPYFSNRANLSREVWLEGKSLFWEQIGENGLYSLTNLEHGEYKLKIRVLKNVDGDFMYKTINLKVAPLYYQTLSFRICMFLLFILLLYVLYEIRVKYLKNKNLELEETINNRTKELKASINNLEQVKVQLKKETIQQKKLIGSISHDIITPIKYLSITAKKLYTSEGNDNLSKKNYLESIYKSTVELYNFSKALKDYALLYSKESNNENHYYNLYDLVQEKIELFKVASIENGNELYNKIHKEKLTNISKNVLAVILHNLIDNATKYTINGQVVISNIENDAFFCIEIYDTGKGMTNQQIDYYDNLQKNVGEEKLLLQKYGLGLNLVLQLLPIINGAINFHKNTESGTKIILKFKKEE